MKGLVRNKIGLIIASIAILLFFIALLLPAKYIPLDTSQDKYHHGFFFLGLTILLYLSTHMRLWVLCIVMVILSSSSELIQILAPQRSSNWQDLQADFYGIAVAIASIFIIRLIRRMWRHRKKAKNNRKQQ